MTTLRKHIIVIFIAAGLARAFAEGTEWNFAVGTQTGFESGAYNEYVFIPSAGDYTLSRLDWEMPFLWKAGVSADIAAKTKRAGLFEFSAAFDFGIVGTAGIMQDYDWAKTNASGTYTCDGILTDYSKHDNSTESLIGFSVLINWRFWKGFGISFGANYRNIHFRAENGYAQHGSRSGVYWTEDMAHTSEYDGTTVTTYSVSSWYVRAGIVYTLAFEKISLFCGGWITPYISSRGKDCHYKNNAPYKNYLDATHGIFRGFSAEIGMSWKFSKKNNLRLCAAGSYFPAIQGNSYLSYAHSEKYSKLSDTEGGSAWKSAGISISLQHSF
ncbi:MAG: omptin family outer membrane protease [Bacteroides sp.]|nr:omptin family outer membrane protease [Prevotella sp.]MCM1407655.1 omptin family outer membrane protease [Treponema brennaborense]MCM1469195.1 omptin family outer membrane protease [Bacteroides sp.]